MLRKMQNTVKMKQFSVRDLQKTFPEPPFEVTRYGKVIARVLPPDTPIPTPPPIKEDPQPKKESQDFFRPQDSSQIKGIAMTGRCQKCLKPDQQLQKGIYTEHVWETGQGHSIELWMCPRCLKLSKGGQ